MMKDKFEKVKTWTKRNSDEIVVWSLFGASAVLYVGVMVVAVKSYNKQMAEWQQTAAEIQDATSRGATVLPGPAGTWWILENQS